MNFLGDNWTVSDPALSSQPVLWMQLKLAATSTALPTPLGDAGAGWHRAGTAGLVTLLGVWLPLLKGAAGFWHSLTNPHAEDAQLAKEPL